jgi:hypothetical protein
MRAYLIIVLPPQLEFLRYVGEREKDFGIQAIITQPSIEGFDIRNDFTLLPTTGNK